MAVALDKFLGQLRESGLLPPAELDALLADIPAPRKADGEQLARELVKRKKITAYQAQEVYGGRGKKLVLGNYVIQDKLGQGGMGMVLKAEHRRMERIVALKVMSKAAVESPEAVKRFHREVKAAAKLNHPNIVTAFDADEAGGTHFLVMEFVEGTDLSQLVKKNGPLSVEKALTCILGAARGLEFAHENGVVHRDIKPANLLLDAKGNVKILDMGLARIESVGGEQAELTGTGQIMGTVDYMAPEQAMNTRKADHRADIYSLGISLWYLLTGRVAYGGETVMEKLMAHQTAPIPSLAEAGVASSPALEAVFRKMVAKTPGDRYQATSEVVAALERCKTSPGDVSPTVNLGPSEDAKLSDFLKAGVGVPPSSGSSRPAVALAPSAAPSTGAGLDVTIVTNTPQADTDPQTQTNLHAPSAALGAKPWHTDWRVWAVGGGGFAAVALLAFVGLRVFGNGSSPKGPPIDPTPPPVAESAGPAFNGAPSSRTPNWALAFDGQDDCVQIPTWNDKPQAITLEAFVMSRRETLIQEVAVDFQGVGFLSQGGNWQFFNRQSRLESLVLPSFVRAKRMSHLAAVFDGNEARCYVDGRLVASRAAPTLFTGPIVLGADLDLRRWFEGEIDELRLSRIARYDREFIPPKREDRFTSDKDTVALYHFDEGTGDVLRDASPNKHHGKIVGAKWVRAETPAAVDIRRVADGFDVVAPGYRAHVSSKGLLEKLESAGVTLIESTSFGGISGGIGKGGRSTAEQAGATLTFAQSDDYRLQYDFAASGFTVKARVSEAAAKRDGADFKTYFVMYGVLFPKQPMTVRTLDAPGTFALPPKAQVTTHHFAVSFADGTELEIASPPTEAAFYREGSNGWDHGFLTLGADNLFRFDIRQPPVAMGAQPQRAIAPFNAAEARAYQDAWAKHLGVPVERHIDLPGGVKLTMVLIPPGEFLMGSSDEERARFLREAANDQWALDRIPHEEPQHRVRITQPFYLGKYEVTQAQWQAVMGNNPSGFKDNPSHPVEQLSWDDIQPFLARLNDQHAPAGVRFAMPSEAQWEYAARAGTKTIWCSGDGDEALREVGWFNANAEAKTHPVGQLRRNGWGLYDMHGNVWEWCADWHSNDYYRQSPETDPMGPTSGSGRELRGGAWSNHAWNCRSAYRDGISPEGRDNGMGFRLAAVGPFDAKETRAHQPPAAGPPLSGNFALRFDGLNDYVELPAWPELPPATALTIEAWATLERRLLTRGGRSVFQCGPLHVGAGRGPEGKVRWVAALVGPNKVEPIVGQSIAAPNERVHLALALNDRGLILYVNGREEARKGFAGLAMPAKTLWEEFFKRPMTVGGGTAPDGKPANFFPGTIDELRISKTKRYDANFTPEPQLALDADTLALYRFSEGKGEVLGDASPNQRHGKIVGATWISRGQAPPPALAEAAEPAAMPFDEVEAKEHQAAWAKQLKVAVTTPNTIGMKMVVIPPGSFTMGRSPRDAEVLQGEKLSDDDLPAHTVTLTKPFAIAATEVTQREWKLVMNTTPWAGQKQVVEDPDRPATYVSWKDAVEFCRRLSLRERPTYRLPTEAEWEWACRAGTETTFNFGEDTKELHDHAWVRGNSQDLPHPVAQRNSNNWGLFDMHGNAWEWAEDVYGPYSAEAAVDPRSQAAGNKRTLRGGCFWSVPIADYRSSARREWPETLGYSESGFRPVRTLDTRLAPTQGAP